jgi:hypothetical protein
MFGFKIITQYAKGIVVRFRPAEAQLSDCQTQDTAGRARPEALAAPGGPRDIGSALQGPWWRSAPGFRAARLPCAPARR